MPTKQTESAPSFLQVYTQVRRDRMKHSFLRQISSCVDWRGIRTLLNKKYTKTQNATASNSPLPPLGRIILPRGVKGEVQVSHFSASIPRSLKVEGRSCKEVGLRNGLMWSVPLPTSQAFHALPVGRG